MTNEVMPLLGGVEDSSSPAPDAAKQLLMRGSAIMGGIEVKGPRGDG